MTPTDPKHPFSEMYRKGYMNGCLKTIDTIMANLARMREKINEETRKGGNDE